ncbi:glycosyl hydrolase [Streptomyces sp. NPDC051642]|uniref:glycosyl hydrolase n=1 Tax=unclassified Streptomyces TaxID=2593676 RepID=UPI0034483263
MTTGEASESAPAPLFRDPVHDGATDPVVVHHRQRGEWWMLYTARRATAPGPGVAWVHGSDIGIAVSTDGGGSWVYRGTARGLDIEWGRNTFWAPEVTWAEGAYHMFVSYIQGVPDRWEGHDRQIIHYTSGDLVTWTFRDVCDLGSPRVIDAAIHPLPGGGYRMWFKDEAHGSHTYSADSTDLYRWSPPQPVITGRAHEGPNVFALGGRYWMVTDEWQGLAVHRSEDLTTWRRTGQILDKPGSRRDDADHGRHADVVVTGHGTAYVFYFTHPELASLPEGTEETYRHRRSTVQVAQLSVADGQLHCDRDRDVSAPFLPTAGTR